MRHRSAATIGLPALPIAVCLAALTAGCASAPSAPDTNTQTIEISTRVWKNDPWEPQYLGFGRITTEPAQSLAGAKCTARNDSGTWEVITPGRLAVPTGGGTLKVECSMPGYETAKLELSCVTPRSRSTTQGAMAGVQLIAALGPAAVYAAPVVVLGALAGSAAFGAAAGNATAGPDADVCRYFPASGSLDLWMRKRPPQ